MKFEDVYRGDNPTFKRQLKIDGVPVDLEGSEIKFAVKQNPEDTEYLIEAALCNIDVAAEGKFSITLTSEQTATVCEKAHAEFQWKDSNNNILTIERFFLNIHKDIVA